MVGRMRKAGWWLKRCMSRPRGLRGRVLIAGVPRCGSTLLIRSLANLPVGSGFPRTDPWCRFVDDLTDLQRSPLLKTHALPPSQLPGDVRVVFLFGDVVSAVISTLQRRYDRGHFRHCGYSAVEDPDIVERDDLGYKRIFDAWMHETTFPVLAMRYEKMWEHVTAIGTFLEMPLNLPEKRERQTRPEPELAKRIERTYAELIDKIRQSPDISLRGPVPDDLSARMQSVALCGGATDSSVLTEAVSEDAT